MTEFFEIIEKSENKYLVLIIYDIVDNKRRTKLAKFLCGYGFRIQKSAFEAVLDPRQYKTLLRKLESYLDVNEDSIRVYKIVGYGEVTIIGQEKEYSCEEVIIV